MKLVLPGSKPKDNYWILVGSILLANLAGGIGSLATFSAIPTWYAFLNKPFFSPPNWLFGPVWTTLYILMGISLYLVWRQGDKSGDRKKFIQFYFVQLALNALWSLIFFGAKELLLALLVLILMWIFILQCIRTAYILKNKMAAYLLFPYLAWVTFAGILNAAIFLLN